MARIVQSLLEAFDPSRFADAVALWLPNIVVAAATLVVFWILWRGLRRALTFGMRRAHIDETATQFVLSIARYALVTISAVTALAQLGIDVSGILTSLGVVGLTIGFAARDALSNIISGLFIFWDRPFVIGDLVEIGGTYGRVHEITMRSTRVVTPDGRMLAVPNGVVVNSTVASYTNFPHLRLGIELTVGTGEDLGRISTLLLQLVTDDDRFMQTPPPRVVLTAVGDFNLTVELQTWLKDERTHVEERFALRRRAFETLRSAGIDMPCETFTLNPLSVATAPAA